MNTPKRHFSSSHSRVAAVAVRCSCKTTSCKENKTKSSDDNGDMGGGGANEKEI